jgi:hypothetical protein
MRLALAKREEKRIEEFERHFNANLGVIANIQLAGDQIGSRYCETCSTRW